MVDFSMAVGKAETAGDIRPAATEKQSGIGRLCPVGIDPSHKGHVGFADQVQHRHGQI